MKRIRHNGGEKVKGGNYWNVSTGERVTLSREGILPGDSDTVYYKARPILILAAGPVLGLVYAAFLPFIGIAIVMTMLVKKLFGGKAEELSKVATFNWHPSEAYLAGKPRKEKEGKTEEKDTGGPAETGKE